ncbi:uncharacterized protein TNIN_120811 [Trichonephila inaurata madagascariensis]|uniref:Uncharacterized protein n=1 Tax=Trichonephila inaurata madagascariensis TaxID=2747483 RepID=A0A8X6I4D3_9ARAC|nr:uncharacterized protein TNIN_120811 [Trichonephila inaurata madagascariensis]
MDKLERCAKTLKSREFTRITKNSASKLDDMERLKKLYYDLKEPGSFGGVKRLTEANGLKKSRVKSFISGENCYSFQFPVRYKFHRRKTIAYEVNELWQSGLVDLLKLSRLSKGYQYILTVIDIMLRYLRVYPIKYKKANTITKIFIKIFKENEIDVETETLLPKFDIPLYNDDHADFVAGFNANMKKIFIDPPLKTRLIARESIFFYHTYEIKLEEGDLLQQINSKLLDVGLNDVKFSESNGHIIVTLPFNVPIEFKRDAGPKLMTVLNIIDDAYVIRGGQFKIQFLYTRPASSIKDESFDVIVYKVFPTTCKETKFKTFFIPSGMYHQANDLFKEFKFIFLQLAVDSRVRLHVSQNILVTFGERLKDLLGFVQRTFTHGDYKSEYPLELRAGITEVYVYCEIVSKSLLLEIPQHLF